MLSLSAIRAESFGILLARARFQLGGCARVSCGFLVALGEIVSSTQGCYSPPGGTNDGTAAHVAENCFLSRTRMATCRHSDRSRYRVSHDGTLRALRRNHERFERRAHDCARVLDPLPRSRLSRFLCFFNAVLLRKTALFVSHLFCLGSMSRFDILRANTEW